MEKKQISLPYILRKVNHKSVLEIFQEIRFVQNQPFDDQDIKVLGNRKKLQYLARTGIYLPKFVRASFWERIIWNSFSIKKLTGLVSVTSIGMYGKKLG